MRPWEVIQGDAIARLSEMPAASFHVAICSPPYWALRSYLPKGHPLKPLELGQERIPDCFAWARGVPRCAACYVCKMTDVFAAVKRALRDDGTLWVTVAGSYCANGRYDASYEAKHPERGALSAHKLIEKVGEVPRKGFRGNGWKAKDYVNVPALLAESLRCDGWYLRAEVALTKVAPTPESCRDRPTRATEKLYLFAKQPTYFYDQQAERPDSTQTPQRRHVEHEGPRDVPGQPDHTMTIEPRAERATDYPDRNLWDWWPETDDDLPPAVWPWRPQPQPRGSKHYATFPLWLPLRVIKLGTSARGVCPRCGSPWRRVVQGRQVGTWTATYAEQTRRHVETLGWRPSCDCPPAPAVPARVLDCFCGTATTGVATRLLGRHFAGIDLSESYCRTARERLAGAAPLDDAAWLAAPAAPPPAQQSLFAREPEGTPSAQESKA